MSPRTLFYRLSGWMWLWILCSFLPMIPFILPILHDTLGDTPLAYLTWIPIMAFFWGGWNLYRIPFSPEHSKKSLAAGLSLLLSTGLIILLWTDRDLALFIWPMWSIGVICTMFGFGAVKLIWKPMVYLMLVCPTIYLKIVAIVSPSLEKFTMTIVRTFSRSVTWMNPDVMPGGVGVKFGSQWVLVHVSTACSGADSILAVLILLPVMLVVFKTSFIRKIVLVIAGSLLAVIANTARILIIMTALHDYGITFALHILHPILGAALFFLTIASLLIFSSRRFMLNPLNSVKMMHGPDKWRLITIIAMVVVFSSCFGVKFLR